MDVRTSNLTPYCHVSLPCITKFVIMQTTKEVNPRPHIVPCVNMWSVTFLFLSFFFFLCHSSMLVHVYATSSRKAKWSGPHHIIEMLHFVLFHNITCYTKSIIARIHVNTTKLHNITCTLVATCVILWSLECMHGAPNMTLFWAINQESWTSNITGPSLILSLPTSCHESWYLANKLATLNIESGETVDVNRQLFYL